MKNQIYRLRIEYFLRLAVFFIILSSPIFGQLSGTKTIGGTTPDYATIKAAIQDLNLVGVSSPGVTFLIRDGIYNEDSLSILTATSSVSAPIIFKPDAGATVVINVTPPSTAYDFAIKIEATQYVTFDGSNNGTTSRDLTINSLGANGRRGIWVSGPAHYTSIKNCNVNAGFDIASPSTTTRSIDFLYVSGAGNDADFILCENNFCRYAYTGIRLEGVASGDVMESAIVRNNIIDSVGNAGVYSHYQSNTLIYNNDINLLRGSSATMYGVYVGTASSNVRVYKNIVHDLNQLSTTSVTYGLYASGTSTLAMNSFFNNFVYNLTVPETGTGAVYGLYSGTTNTTVPDTFAFNTVNLTGTSTGNRTTSGFYKGSSTGPAYVYNNILQNTRTDGTTGIASAIYKTSAATVVTSDNNNLYVGTPDAQHQTGRIGTTTYATLADWQVANSSDAVSVTENAPFVSGTNLHIQTTVPTQLESGGVPIAGITDDFDGDLRNVSTPDIGADEGPFTGLDLTPPSISYTLIPNTTNTTSVTLTATITDPSGIATGANLPRLYIKKINDVAYVFNNTPVVAGDDYTFTINYSALGGVVIDDTIQYYVAAQDMNGNAGTLPAGGSGSNPPGTVAPANPDSYIILDAPLAGDYTVGLALFRTHSGKDITFEKRERKVEITELVNESYLYPDGWELNNSPDVSITGETSEIKDQEPIKDLVYTHSFIQEYYVPVLNGEEYDGSLYYEFTPEQIERYNFRERGVYATITAAVNDVNLRGISAAVRLILTDATYPTETFPIIFQSVLGTSSTNTITVVPGVGVTTTITSSEALPVFDVDATSNVIFDGRQNGTGSTNAMTISNTSTLANSTGIRFINGAGNNIVRYVNLVSMPSSSTTRAIELSTSVINPAGNSDNLVEYCDINGGRYGIYFNGTLANPNNNNIFRNNKVYESTFAMFYMVNSSSNTTIEGNEIYSLTGQTTANSAISLSANGTGGVNNIIGNKIYDIQNTSTSTVRGISGTPGTGSTLNIINNFISLTNDNGTKTSVYAIQISGTTEHTANIYYNTMRVGGVHTGGTANVIVSGGLLKSNTGATATFNAKNNISVNTRTGGTAGVFHTNFFVGSTGIVGTLDINYNVWFASGDTSSFHSGWSGFLYNDQQTYRDSAAPHEQNSIFYNVNFVSNTDLHVFGTSVGDTTLSGLPIAGITMDIDGDTRDLVRPYRGADEGDIPLPVELTSFSASVSDNLITLNWSTNSETNNRGFEVERRVENVWQTAGFVDGNGTTTSTTNYTYSDNYNFKSITGTISYRLKQIDFDGSYHYSNVINVDVDFAPKEYSLYQNYPNPFNPSTTIKYALPFDSNVKIILYNLLGEVVTELVNTVQKTGYHDAVWNANDLASGIYFYTIQAKSVDGVKDFTSVKKMMLIK